MTSRRAPMKIGGALVVALCIWTGCGGGGGMPLRAIGTDGQVHTGRYSDPNDNNDAVWIGGQAVTVQAGISSAVRDLACPREQIRVVLNETDWDVGAKGSDILLDGCGQRATYRKVCAYIGRGVECRLFLTSRFSLHEGSR